MSQYTLRDMLDGHVEHFLSAIERELREDMPTELLPKTSGELYAALMERLGDLCTWCEELFDDMVDGGYYEK